jgi:hypothetical protein
MNGGLVLAAGGLKTRSVERLWIQFPLWGLAAPSAVRQITVFLFGAVLDKCLERDGGIVLAALL